MSGASEQAPRSPPRIAPLLGILAVQAAFIVAVYSIASISTAPGMLVPLDAIALPGENFTIGVRIEGKSTASSSSTLSGARLTFVEKPPASGTSEPKPEVQVSAGPDGVASIQAKAPANAGILFYHAKLVDPSRAAVERPEEDLLLEVVPADRAILFVIAPQSLIDESGEPIHSGAAAALQALVKERTIVYVATRKKDSPGRLRAWLASEGFPLGAVLTTENAQDGTLSGLIASLGLNRWKRQLWGVVVNGRDANALAAAGLRVVQLSAAPTFEVDDHTVFLARDWNEARKRLESSRY